MPLLDQSYSTGYEAGEDANFRYNAGNERYGQGFKPIGDDVTSVKLYLKKVGTPTGNLYVQIQTDNAGVPSNTSLGQSDNVDVSTLSTSYGWITFTFATPVTVTPGTQYHIVLFGSFAISTSNWVRVAGDGNTASYSYGTLKNYTGSAWNGDYGDFDIYFEQYTTDFTITGERSAKIIAPESSNDNRNAKIHGTDTTNSARSATIKGTFRIPRKLFYKIIVKNSSGVKLGVIDTYRNLKFGKRLNNFGMAEFEMRVNDPKMALLVELRKNTIEIYREKDESSELVWAGEQAVRRGKLNSAKNNWATIYCYSWLEQLNARYTGAEVSYSATDAGAIAWDLIDTTQTETNGDFGFTEGTITTTTSRYRNYTNQNIMEAIINLANVQSGFDFEITDTKVFNVYNLLGTNKTEDIVFIYGKNIKNVEIVEDFSRPVNRAIVLGEADGQVSLQRIVRNNSTKQTEYKLREGTFAELDVSNVNTLQDKGDAALRKYEDILMKIGFELVKGDTPNITDFGLGDGITIVVQDGVYNINEQYRVFEWEVEFDQDDTELLSLTLGNFILQS